MNITRVNEDSLENNNTAEVTEPLHVEEKKSLDQKPEDVQSTSKGITSVFSGTVIVNLPETEKKPILQKNDSLSSLDELAERLLKEKGEIEDDDSFVTVDGWGKDIATSTEPAIIFSVNERTQNIITARNEPSNYPPPPPYDYSTTTSYQGRLGQTPVYQERYVGRGPMVPHDASRSPPFRRNYDGNEFSDVIDAFDTKRIRNKFVQKVFFILSLQLLFTFGVIGAATFEDRVKKFILTHNIYLILAIGVYVLTLLILFCYDQTRRIFPLNFILLSLTTAAVAYMMAAVTCVYSTHVVLVAFGVSTAVCILVTMVACQSWFDVTECGMILCLATFIIMVYGIIAMFVTIYTGSNTTYLIYSCLMTLLFCMYLMYDTQQILGGRRIELSPEEYILGALTLYIDFMMIFQQMLYIIAASNDLG